MKFLDGIPWFKVLGALFLLFLITTNRFAPLATAFMQWLMASAQGVFQ